MEYILSKRFEKDFSKLPQSTKLKAIVALEKFVEDPNHISLRNHELIGRLKDHYSINVTGDVRAVYVFVEDGVVQFIAIGSHCALYR